MRRLHRDLPQGTVGLRWRETLEREHRQGGVQQRPLRGAGEQPGGAGALDRRLRLAQRAEVHRSRAGPVGLCPPGLGGQPGSQGLAAQGHVFT